MNSVVYICLLLLLLPFNDVVGVDIPLEVVDPKRLRRTSFSEAVRCRIGEAKLIVARRIISLSTISYWLLGVCPVIISAPPFRHYQSFISSTASSFWTLDSCLIHNISIIMTYICTYVHTPRPSAKFQMTMKKLMIDGVDNAEHQQWVPTLEQHNLWTLRRYN